MLAGFERRVDHNAKLTKKCVKAASSGRVGLKLRYPFPYCNCEALLNPRGKKKEVIFDFKEDGNDDLLGRTGASDTCVTAQSGGECEGGKGSTSYSTRVCVSNHC